MRMGRFISIVIGTLFCAALLMAQSNMFWSQNQPTGLVGWWKLCGDTTMGRPCVASSSTTVADSSGYGNSGTWSGTAAGTTGYYSAGKVGPWAGAFNGVATTGTVLTATVAGTISQFTLSEWVYLTSTNSGYTVVAKFGGTSIYPISSNGGPQLRIVDNSFAANPNTFGSTTSGFWLNTWHLFTVTEDGATVRVYIDGALSASSPMSNPGASVTNPVLQIGNLYSGRDLIGYVDDVRVYNRALTAGEIAGLALGHN